MGFVGVGWSGPGLENRRRGAAVCRVRRGPFSGRWARGLGGRREEEDEEKVDGQEEVADGEDFQHDLIAEYHKRLDQPGFKEKDAETISKEHKRLFDKLSGTDQSKLAFLSQSDPGKEEMNPFYLEINGEKICLIFETARDAVRYSRVHLHETGLPTWVVESQIQLIFHLCENKGLVVGVVPSGALEVKGKSEDIDVERARKSLEDLFKAS